MKKTVLFFFLVIFSLNLFSKDGILRGTIIDESTGEVLIGATVILINTTKGAAADLDGNFTIEGISSGIYDVKCQFISYDDKIITGIEIKDGDVSLLNFILKPSSMQLNTVVVTAKAVKRTESAVLTVQKRSATVVDGISSQQITRSGDSDAASALKRVTGVSVEGGKYVYVRGLGDRYSKTVLNGAVIPGLDPNRNSVQMDLFPANLIDNMIIHKTYSPDLPGDFTGGYVNIVTKDFPEDFILSSGFSLGINSQASFNPNYLTYKGSSTDWLGYDNGFRDMPTAAQGQIPTYTSNKLHSTQVTESFNKIMGSNRENSSMDGSFSFSIGDQKKLFGKQLGLIFGLTYSNSTDFYDNGVKGLWTLVGSGDKTLNKQQYYSDTKGANEVLWGTMFNVSYKFHENHKISLNLMHNQGGVSSARYMYGQKASDDPELFIETRVLQYLQRGFTNGQLRGSSFFSNFYRLKANWLVSYTRSQQDEPDMRFFTNSVYPDLAEDNPNRYAVNPSVYSVPARYYRTMDEDNINAKLDFILPIPFVSENSKLKFGGDYLYKYRDFRDKRIDYRFQFPDNTYNNDVNGFFADENIGLNYFNQHGRYGLYVENSAATDDRNSYIADQIVSAGYLLGDIPLKKMRFVIGARVEATNVNVHNLSNPLSTDYSSIDKSYVNILPALNITYSLKENMNIRAALSRTLARPNFRELAPFASQDFAGGETYIGNESLLNTQIDNIDLRWEMFMKPSEIISVSAFYKIFHNPIELVDNPIASNAEITWKNVDRATVYGVEIDCRKQLDFIDFFKNVKVGANFTYVVSETELTKEELELIHATDSNFGTTRPMFGQSPYIINAFVGYNNPKWGTDVNASFNVTGQRLVLVTKGGTPDVYEQPSPKLNVVVKQKLADNWSLKIKASNILNSEYKEVYNWEGRDYIYQMKKSGIGFTIGVSYSIK